jgi:hypothetical protein
MSVGYGITPYGEGDWGGLNTIVPGVGAIAAAGAAPVLNRDVIPAGGAKISGSEPVIVSTERRITPDTAVLVVAGQTPEVRIDLFITPAANDAVIAGFAPLIEQSAVLTPPVGALSIVGAAPTAIDGKAVTPDAASLDVVGHAPVLHSDVVVPAGAVGVAGFAPGVAQSEVVTPTGGAVLIGSAPGVVVSGLVKVPGTASLDLFGRIPTVSQSRLIRPPAGQLTLVGGTPIIKNPNWVSIDDSQTPNWQRIAA